MYFEEVSQCFGTSQLLNVQRTIYRIDSDPDRSVGTCVGDLGFFWRENLLM